MRQATPRRFSLTQEIAVGQSSASKTHTVSRGTLEDLEREPTCQSAVRPPCCAVDDAACSVEEILVVHHDALRKVNYLLKVDEFSGCELPAVPECVLAARRVEQQRRHEENLRELKELKDIAEGTTADARAECRVGPCGPVRSASARDSEDEDERQQQHRLRCRGPMLGSPRRTPPCAGPTMQPVVHDDHAEIDDGFSRVSSPAARPQCQASRGDNRESFSSTDSSR